MKARVQKVSQRLDPKPEALLLANATEPHLDQSFFYLFNVPHGLFEDSLVIAHPDGEVDLLTSRLEEETARETAKADPHVQVHLVERDTPDPVIKKVLQGAGSVGLNFRELTHAWFVRLDKMLPGTRWSDASEAIRRARITELELSAEMEHRMNLHGASGRSFATIVAFGPHGAEPHYEPAGARLEPGQSIVCDFGALHRRYISDITRSFHFGPRDDEMKAVHETVEAAQNAALT